MKDLSLPEAIAGSPLPKRPPGPPGLPLLGNMRQLLRDNLKFVMAMARQYGDVALYHLGTMPIYQVNHPDGVQHILQENNRNYSKDTLNFGTVKMLLGNSLLSSDGDFWRRQRRLMQPVFHRRHVAALGELMTQKTVVTLTQWQRLAGNGRPLDVQAEMMALTLEIVTQALFSSSVGSEMNTVGQAITAVLEDMTFRFLRPYYPPLLIPTLRNHRFRAELANLERTIYRLIDERRTTLAGPTTPADDLLALLLLARDEETGQGMSDKQLRDEVITFFIAGHETTALTLTWAFYLLSTHPDAARRLREEVASTLGGRLPTIADLPALTYTRMVIEETMRLYPPAWILNRQSIADDVICGFHIPANSFVAFSPYVLHRHPDYWADPEGFDPERFSPARAQNRPRYAYFPFGGGPRQCIGRDFALVEAQLILATIAQRYELHLPPGHRLQPQALITLRPYGGLPMIVKAIT